jgi:hypothetical protein
MRVHIAEAIHTCAKAAGGQANMYTGLTEIMIHAGKHRGRSMSSALPQLANALRPQDFRCSYTSFIMCVGYDPARVQVVSERSSS